MAARSSFELCCFTRATITSRNRRRVGAIPRAGPGDRRPFQVAPARDLADPDWCSQPLSRAPDLSCTCSGARRSTRRNLRGQVHPCRHHRSSRASLFRRSVSSEQSFSASRWTDDAANRSQVSIRNAGPPWAVIKPAGGGGQGCRPGLAAPRGHHCSPERNPEPPIDPTGSSRD